MRRFFESTFRAVPRLVSAVALAALSVSPALALHDPGYVPIDLGTLGGASSMALGINKNNEVVGVAQTADGSWHAFLWTNGQMFDLGVLQGFDESEARGVNAARQAVGRSMTSNGLSSRATAWLSGNRIDLGTLGGAESMAQGVNNSSHAVGSAQLANSDWHAFVWRSGQMLDLGALDGHSLSGAAAINDNGLIAGWSEDGEGNRIAVYWANDEITEIGSLGGLQTEATALSRNDFIVGYGDTGSEEKHAFVWDSGQLTDLGTFPIGGDSRAFGVNVLREVVGDAYLSSIGETQAVLWRPGRLIQNINSLLPPGSGWDTLTTATGISDSGHICGTGRTDSGESHAFLLVPALGMANPIPGRAGVVNTFDVAGALPFAMVHVVYGFQYGSYPIPGCSGVNFGIRSPKLVRSVRADETGHALFDVFVPQAARNRGVLFQAVESGSCEKSIILIWTFF